VDQILCRLPMPPRNKKRSQHSCLVNSVVEQRGTPSCLPQLPPHLVPEAETVGAFSTSSTRGRLSLVAPRALCRMSCAGTAATACVGMRVRGMPRCAAARAWPPPPSITVACPRLSPAFLRTVAERAAGIALLTARAGSEGVGGTSRHPCPCRQR